jgi:diguanylate cyclase (GGDEF)-like protein/putative nucleotidyltransferase with HDIG domain
MQALRLWRQVKRSHDDRLTTAEERRLAGRISGALWLSGGLTLLVMLPMPGERIERVWLVAAIAALGVAAGAVLLGAVHWDRAPRRLFHVSTALMPVAVAILQALSGGGASPTHQYLWLVVVYAAFFFPPVPAVAYGVACSAVSAAPLLYDSGAVEGNLARELLVVVPLFFIVGAIIFAGRRVLGRLSRQATALEREQRRMIAEQSSLRRVATAVAAGAPPDVIFALVSSEVGRLLSADAAAIGRYISERRVQVMGVSQGSTDAGTVLEVHPDDELARVRLAGRPIRIDRYADDAPSRAHRFGYRSFVGAPVHVGGAIWGVLVAGSRVADGFTLGAEERLRDYADLIATAVSNAEDRTRLDRQAGVDPLTGMPNYRAFRDRLEDEVSRARRHGRPLTVAVVDIDRFGEATDRVGHDESEQSLADVAALVRSAVRDEDVVARLGADELGIAFVESDRATALLAAERARQLVAHTPLRHGMRLTVSVGLCDLDAAPGADELLRRADAALFWSKEHGRDRCWVYDPTVVRDLADYARRRDLEREQGLAGLQALARAIDAKDPATQEHSERVAALAARLAAARGWREECVERLREAALLHDVGKIGVPDSVLLKPGPLEPAETALMRDHAALGARIVGDVLDDLQVRWIAAHHERPDGTGYPRGLSGPEIPEGAALLALADAWDSMVSDRVYSPRRTIDDALADCRALVGEQFTAEAVEALESLHAHGDLAMAALRMHRPTPEAARAA